ncbi:aryl-sulfate sulfotransferase [uncultured Lacinutrix sp.]|uniref:aryl-sulfate sulfotransferase n=1 Tax=uncultured Lacinutrix sp. TaxID=574032 RepID=UPI00261612D8|nr:aryl-sulfate sulfotransferase [uncultured Lacinutrix sp.]
MKRKYLIIIISLLINLLYSQNTVGIITNENDAYNGYTLFAPNNSNSTYLINNCGERVHEWITNTPPGNSVYLLENGDLLKAGRVANNDISFGGVGGKIEKYNWDGDLIWEYIYSTNLVSQHHDIYPLPNGNILMLAVTTITEIDAIEAGRDPNLISESKLYNEQILELEPTGTNTANIIWEWNFKDHLIQDIDPAKSNYGVVADNPQLLNINFLNNNNVNPNWLHINSIQYNEDLDQIILSSRLMSEIYIIDHSTTTAEAAAHTGGTYGKGGDILYRWGNPQAYNRGSATDRVLFGQHFPHWIEDGLTDAGKIIIFNNGNSRGYSSIDIINPPTSSPGFYLTTSDAYGPNSAEWIYSDPTPSNFFSAILSSATRLENGNTLICDGDSGYFFEIDPSNNIVWEYINPDSNTGILSQGDTPIANFVFRATKYPTDYVAFTGRDLTPSSPIELNPNIDNCNILSVDDYSYINTPKIKVHPNPTMDFITIESKSLVHLITLYDIYGKKVKEIKNQKSINLKDMKVGVYIARISTNNNETFIKKIIKK